MICGQRLFLSLGDPLRIAFGEDRLGRDAVGADAERTRLGREVLGEDLDACLGGCLRDGRPGMRDAPRS